MTTPTTMICSKCRGPMTSDERNGITIDQCAECCGIFLDRGELERLIDAEAEYTTARRSQPERDERYGQQRHHDEYDEDHRGHDQRRRRGGFLGDLFHAHARAAAPLRCTPINGPTGRQGARCTPPAPRPPAATSPHCGPG